MPIMTTDWIEPATFASVPSHSQKEHACMPPLQGYDAQMRIAAPTRVTIRDGSTLTIPVCARGILPVVDDPQLPRFVAVDTRTGTASYTLRSQKVTVPTNGQLCIRCQNTFFTVDFNCVGIPGDRAAGLSAVFGGP